jgi:rhodanese-related sulfurtransferase
MERYRLTKVEGLTPGEVAQFIEDEGKERLVVLDVREPWEWESDTGHVKDSFLIPMNQIPESLDKIRRLSSKRIGVICNSGERSYYVCRYLQSNGIQDVFNIEGGIIKWNLSGLEVEYGAAKPEQTL